VDPVTYKRFTDNTHIVALANTGNVFAWEAVERLNVKAKMWRDLVSDVEFGRKDIVTLQDPQNVNARDLSQFKYLEDGEGAQKENGNGGGSVNLAAMGNEAKVLRAKEAVAKARAERQNRNAQPKASSTSLTTTTIPKHTPSSTPSSKKAQTSHHTTGLAAASLTSTGLTPHTSSTLTLLTDEEYLLKPKRIKTSGYAILHTSLGPLHLTLHPLHAPKAVWNFIALAKRGYYNGLIFHRNIRNFMIQTGDPTGTGKGGQSVWGKNFEDEFDGPLKHDTRGMVAMANKGKDTNSSQFFITYRAAKHLDRKHTVFGKVDLETQNASADTLNKLENAPGDDKNRPLDPIRIEKIDILLDPFEEFLKQRDADELKEQEEAEIKKKGGREDEKMTWTGKRIRGTGEAGGKAGGGVGKYLKAALEKGKDEDEIVGFADEEVDMEPARKKAKGGGGGGFGNFDGW
jgi:peptidyl-prolyl cis-trans isomerase-like protein 2